VVSQINLGVMYADGRGVVRDDYEAARWFRAAATQGHAVGQNRLGIFYAKGRGVARNDAEAVRWFRAAAAQGDANAIRNLQSRGINVKTPGTKSSSQMAQSDSSQKPLPDFSRGNQHELQPGAGSPAQNADFEQRALQMREAMLLRSEPRLPSPRANSD
jgi:TPR repeat protein